MNRKDRIIGGLNTAVVLALLVAFVSMGMAQDMETLEQNPAYLDLDKAFDFSEVTPTVNIHLPKFLLDNMLSQMDGGPNDPFAEAGVNIADLTKDIQLMRMVVFDAKDPETMKAARSGLEKLKKSMGSKWLPIVNVPEGNVTIFAMGDESGSRLGGLALMVSDANAVVIGNIVGEVQIGKIVAAASKIAAKGGFDPGKNEMLQKLMGGMNPAAASPGPVDVPPDGQPGSDGNPQGR
ncbi:MAG: DUF4252 domain-containing protein [Acidobacteriota bacterium]